MNVAAALREHRRHAVLAILAEAGAYEHNEHVIQSALTSAGLPVSRQALRDELRWLEDRGLLRVSHPSGTWQARLLARGLDVAKGAEQVEGVHPPLPE